MDIPQRILMGPGPSDAHHRVLSAMSAPLIGHLDPAFLKIMDEVKSSVKRCFLTENELTFVVSAPGSAGMETCFVNLIEPGDEVVIGVNGVFGGRMVDIAERCGATVHTIEVPWGEVISTEQVKQALSECNPKLVALVHAETSTGACQPIKEISDLVHNAGALMVVDAVTSFCGVELRVDDWGIDAIYSGTQKCLSAPPGLSPVSFSSRAVEVMEQRKTKVQSWFLDLTMVRKYWSGAKRAYHHTAPVSSVYAIREALQIVEEEGLENRWNRHREIHEYLKKELTDMGFTFLVDERYRLPNLNSVFLPEGQDEAKLRSALLHDFNIEVGSGLGKFAGKIWRIGIMGESCTHNHVNALTGALRQLMI